MFGPYVRNVLLAWRMRKEWSLNALLNLYWNVTKYTIESGLVMYVIFLDSYDC